MRLGTNGSFLVVKGTFISETIYQVATTVVSLSLETLNLRWHFLKKIYISDQFMWELINR